MPLNLPENALEVEKRQKTDVQRELSQSNPFFKNSVLGAFITGTANRIFDFYIQLRQLRELLFPDTAEGSFLERWAAIFGKTRLAATKASGNLVATGTATTNIPLGTTFTSNNGNLYDSTGSATISAQALSVASITRSGTVATVITSVAHGLAGNVPVTIAGADQADYNGVFDIIVIGLDTFTFSVTGSPATPATGTITASFTSASVPVESQEFQDSANGVNVNLDSGSPLTLQSPIVNVDNQLLVDFGTIGGGTNQETISQLRVRMLERIQNPVAHFSEDEIIDKAKEVAGVTRVFVFPITPNLGQVTIYFTRDNDASPIPSASEVTDVKNKIIEIIPANTAVADVIVSAPTPVSVNFTFTAISPDTSTMQTAIENSLQQFFEEETFVGVNVDEDSYRSAIINTIDPEAGNRLQTFTLSTPTGDVAIATGEIGILGMVTFT